MNNFSSVWYRFPHTTYLILLYLYHMNNFFSVWYRFPHTTYSIFLHLYHMNNFSSVWYRFPHTTHSILLYLYHVDNFSLIWYRFPIYAQKFSTLTLSFHATMFIWGRYWKVWIVTSLESTTYPTKPCSYGADIEKFE